jgi:hypothetical protein
LSYKVCAATNTNVVMGTKSTAVVTSTCLISVPRCYSISSRRTISHSQSESIKSARVELPTDSSHNKLKLSYYPHRFRSLRAAFTPRVPVQLCGNCRITLIKTKVALSLSLTPHHAFCHQIILFHQDHFIPPRPYQYFAEALRHHFFPDLDSNGSTTY